MTNTAKSRRKALAVAMHYLCWVVLIADVALLIASNYVRIPNEDVALMGAGAVLIVVALLAAVTAKRARA